MSVTFKCTFNVHVRSVLQTYLALFQKEKKTQRARPANHRRTEHTQTESQKERESSFLFFSPFSSKSGWQPTWPANKQLLFVIQGGQFRFQRWLNGSDYNYQLICKNGFVVTLSYHQALSSCTDAGINSY